MQKLVALEQRVSMGGGGMSGDGAIKPKIDVNVALMQIGKMIARIADALKVHIPAHEMLATPQDLTAMAQGQTQPAPMAGPPAGAIPPIGGMDGMQPSGAPGGGGEKAGSLNGTRHADGSAFSLERLSAGASLLNDRTEALLKLNWRLR
jgi:hypothetical protein